MSFLDGTSKSIWEFSSNAFWNGASSGQLFLILISGGIYPLSDVRHFINDCTHFIPVWKRLQFHMRRYFWQSMRLPFSDLEIIKIWLSVVSYSSILFFSVLFKNMMYQWWRNFQYINVFGILFFNRVLVFLLQGDAMLIQSEVFNVTLKKSWNFRISTSVTWT